MSLRPSPIPPVPEATARVALRSFRKGNLYLTLRDEIGTIYADEQFSALFPPLGQPAAAPWRLALVCVMQFIEGLTDRQAADAVRGRIDLKYALSLELDDAGFDYSILSEFRQRLIAGGIENQVLDTLLSLCQTRGWIKERGKQRTDSTHVLAAIRGLNRMETVAETLRATLNALAVVAPDWLLKQVSPAWFDRYSTRIEEYRLPKSKEARQAYAQTVGADGAHLLNALYAADAPPYLRAMPAVEILRQVWLQQYMVMEGSLRLRCAEDLPPAGVRIESPYDAEARYATKRDTHWSGYKVHLTESCDPDGVHLITHIETTQAQVADADRAAPIQDALAEKALSPGEHLLDAGYVDAALIVASQQAGITITGPVRPDVSWQAQTENAYDLSAFTIDWENQRVTYPQGHTNVTWNPHPDQWGNAVISIQFPRPACRACPVHHLCSKAKDGPRYLTLRMEAEHKALQAARAAQKTPEWKTRYDLRAGIESSISQSVRAFELRQTRYVGLARTHLQHVFTATAMNVVRLTSYLRGSTPAKTRPSRFAALAPAA
ncbi:MAG: IS1182 family transposase [Ardenticatenales bacterium]|nr:IS1182 family transposase [Ardenticatenales bacterium]